MTKLAMPFDDPTTYKGHSGVDFGEATNTPILASGPGKINWSGYVNERAGYGVIVEYDQYKGIEFLYCHQPKNGPRPKKDSRFVLGGFLGGVGSTGSRSTGPHLHLEVLNGKGAHTYDGVWLYFDKSRVVGDGSTAGGNDKPIEPTNEEEIMKPLLFQLDPAIDGRWVLVDYQNGAYWPIRNGWQLDRVREDKNVREVYGPQPIESVDGLAAVGL